MTTQEEHTGQCKCGELTFELKGTPLFTHACHCLDCQRRTGTAFSMTTIVLSRDLSITHGDLAVTKINSRSTQYNCKNCQTVIYVGSSAFPSTVIMRSGTFDDLRVATPGAHIWVRRKQPWLILPDDIPQYEEQYDRDVTWPADSLDRFRAAGSSTSD